jgi:bis(5'-nucleosyl)-tetraphosphatase (symmetrical)
MKNYCIGDIQGCFDELQTLLQLINFDRNHDCLWFVGDLVNRGAKSLETMRFVKDLPQKHVVLGNHDLHLLALANRKHQIDIRHSLHDILSAPDKDELLYWLRQQPLFYYDEKTNFALTHAGIYPLWNIEETQSYAKEAEKILRDDDNYLELLHQMYGNHPDQWTQSLTGWSRIRFIINCFTRMRFCDTAGTLNLTCHGKIGTQPEGYMPWFQVPNRPTANIKILFGHWAALDGDTGNTPNVYALDTGCVWGKSLTALCLEDGKTFQVQCLPG